MAVADIGGLMADPNTAGLFGLAQGLLASSGASRLPVTMGAALANGMQGMQAARGTALQQQDLQSQLGLRNLQLEQMKQQWALQQPLLQRLVGQLNGGGGGQVDPSTALAAGASGAMPNMGGASNPLLPAGAMGATQNRPGPTPMTASLMSQSSPQGGMGGQGGTLIPGVPDNVTQWAVATGGLKSIPGLISEYNKPTDFQKLLTAGGFAPGSPQYQAYITGNLNKSNYITPVNARPGSILRDSTTMRPIAYNPSIPAGGTPVFDASGNVVGINSIPGAADVAGKMAQAKTAGEGAALPYTGYDAQGNPLPVTSRTAAVTGNTVPNAGFPATTPVPNSGQSSPNERVSILQQEQARIMALPDTDPSKAANLAAINREIQRAGGQPATEGGIYSTPPLGKQTAANAAQGAPSEQMKADYATMAGAGPQAQQSLEYLDHMLQLAQKKPAYMGMGVGGLPGMTNVSTDAAEYEKARASYLASQGKALGSSGTDAARATLNEAVPEYGKPQDAMIRGLTDQRNQLVASMLRRQFLAPVYQSGDEKNYTALANGFDQNIKPSMAPVLSLPPGSQRAAVQAAIKANPSLRPNYEWAFNHGLLK